MVRKRNTVEQEPFPSVEKKLSPDTLKAMYNKYADFPQGYTKEGKGTTTIYLKEYEFCIKNGCGSWDDFYGFSIKEVDGKLDKYYETIKLWKQYDEYERKRKFAEAQEKKNQDYSDEFASVPDKEIIV